MAAEFGRIILRLISFNLLIALMTLAETSQH
jgi:hypothetical protein